MSLQQIDRNDVNRNELMKKNRRIGGGVCAATFINANSQGEIENRANSSSAGCSPFDSAQASYLFVSSAPLIRGACIRIRSNVTLTPRTQTQSGTGAWVIALSPIRNDQQNLFDWIKVNRNFDLFLVLVSHIIRDDGKEMAGAKIDDLQFIITFWLFQRFYFVNKTIETETSSTSQTNESNDFACDEMFVDRRREW